jgi:DNA polymerase
MALANFGDCPLAATATNLVFAEGNPESGLVLVGEAPGADEDRAGRPFVGASGQLLDRMLASIGLNRERLLVTNLIPWRPPGNRPPTDTEIQVCLPFLLRHLALLRPRLIVTLGALSTRALTRRDDGIRRLRGRWYNVTVPGLPEDVPTLAMLHPAYLLRTPGAKKDAWEDLIALRRQLDKT